MSSDRPTKTEEEKVIEARIRSVREDQRFLAEFIELYRAQPCLWKYSCPDYRVKPIKDEAYARLVAKMQTADPNADKNCVIRKINAMRTAFRREFKKMRKVEKIIKDGLGPPAKSYSTSLWYYDLMKFVVEEQDHSEPPPGANFGDWIEQRGENHTDAEQSFSSVNKDTSITVSTDHDVQTVMEYLEEDLTPEHQPIKIEQVSPESSRQTSPAPAPEAPFNLEINSVYSQKSNHRETLPQYILDQHTTQASLLKLIKQRVAQLQSRDIDQPDYELFGAYVASKLKRAPRKQSVIAEKIISEVLMRASLGVLDETNLVADIKVPTNSKRR